MEFAFNDEQQEIKSTARSFLASRFSPATVRELIESGNPYDDGLWREMCELGWPGIAVAEEHGGMGLGMLELMLLAEEVGYALAPSPLAANACAAIAIELAGSDEQRSRWLPGVASGAERGAAELGYDGGSIVDGARGAAVIGVLAGDAGPRLIEPGEARVERIELLDGSREYSRVAGEGEPLPGDVETARDRAALVLAAEAVGLAQRALDLAVEYAKDREQFGHPIGAYQAVSHRLAKMLWEVEEARSLTYYAGWVADAEPSPLPLAASMAKARAADAATAVTGAALQVLAGVGFTWEHDLHFLLKRARVDALMLGTPADHRARVARLSGLASG